MRTTIADRVGKVVGMAAGMQQDLPDVALASFGVTTRPGAKETVPGMPPIPAVSVSTRWDSVEPDEQRCMPVSVAPLVHVLETAGVRVAGATWTRSPRRITITVVADTAGVVAEAVDHVADVLRDVDLVAVSYSRDAHGEKLAYEYDDGVMQIRTISLEKYAS